MQELIKVRIMMALVAEGKTAHPKGRIVGLERKAEPPRRVEDRTNQIRLVVLERQGLMVTKEQVEAVEAGLVEPTDTEEAEQEAQATF